MPPILKRSIAAHLVLLCWLLVACAPAASEPAAADLQLTVTATEAALAQVTATPEPTAAATATAVETATAVPTATLTVTATATPQPTDTPTASATLEIATLPANLFTPEPTATTVAAAQEPASVNYPASLQPLVDEMFADLAQRSGRSAGALAVSEYESVTWRDGSLGCPQPGMMYTMALVPGYRFVLTDGERFYNYHTNQNGYFVYCEKPQGEPLPSPEE